MDALNTMATVHLLRDVALEPGRRPLPDAGARLATIEAATQPMPPDDDRERAHALGVEQGLAQGLADADERIAAALATAQDELAVRSEQAEAQRRAEYARRMHRLDTVLKTLAQSTAQRVQSLETQAVALAYEAVCRVVGPSDMRHRLICDLVRQGLALLQANALMGVRLHPADLVVLEADAVFEELSRRHAKVQWRADPSLEPGGCVLETECGELDTSLSVQLDRLRAAWLEAHAAVRAPSC